MLQDRDHNLSQPWLLPNPNSCWIIPTTKLEEIEKAVEQLPPEKLAQFRTWFEQFDAAIFDSRTEQDVRAGQLDRHAAEDLRDLNGDETPCFTSGGRIRVMH